MSPDHTYDPSEVLRKLSAAYDEARRCQDSWLSLMRENIELSERLAQQPPAELVHATHYSGFDAVWEFTITDLAGNRVDATITILGSGINLVDIDGRITHRALIDAACGVGGSVLVTVLAFAPEGSGTWTVGLTSGCMPCDGSSIPM